MSRFVFSSDAHIVEPSDLFKSNLPADLRPFALHAAKRDGYIMTMSGEKIIHKLKAEGAGDLARQSNPRLGSKDIFLRLADMEKDGIDAEIIFPSVTMMSFALDNPELQIATCEIYNDWLLDNFKTHRHIFVPAAMLPVGRLTDTLAELKRVDALGYTVAMLPMVTPSFCPAYNSEEWDPIFAYAGERKIPLVMHCSTGNQSLIFERGPGASVINYTRQILEAANMVSVLVAGGLLDRHPNTHVCTIESGASWLAGIAERMDETYNAHQYYVRPKLSLLPSEIVQRQVHCSFQHDKACIASRHVTGTPSLLWASDYPHMEGTFGQSREVVDHLFDEVEITDADKAAILGGNAARLYRLQRPEFLETAGHA